MKNSTIPPILLAILVTMFLTSCEPVEESQATIEAVVRPVKTMVLKLPDTQFRRSHPGKVHAFQRAELAFKVQGTLIKLPVKEGQDVKKGALLARLDPRDYKTNLAKVKSAIAQARAQLKAMKAGARPEDVRVLQAEISAAKARFQEAKQQYERYQNLWKKRVISKAEYDRQESAYNVATAQLNTSRQNMKKGKAGARKEDIEAMESNIRGLIAQRAEAQDALNDTYLKAPFAGVVAKRFIENFQNVKAKEPVFILQDVSSLDIVIDVPEQVLINAKEPEFYNFIAVFEPVPDRKFSLEVKEFSTEADPTTQTYRAVLTMQAPKDLRILPGMTTTVIITEKDSSAESPITTFLVPVNAVFADELDKRYVWMVEPNTMTVQKRAVKVGDLAGESIRVSDGFKVGERIVTAGVHFLQEGMKIRLLDHKNGY
jgi:multidrug efflux system membrane fusion protein